ncbi:MAG: hypothetical protein AB7M93_30515 [Candidatus Obscuribacterales bacterium]
MKLLLSSKIREKLEGRGIDESDLHQCFENRYGSFLEDTREDHRTNPPTQWFISETDNGRELKVVFVQLNKTDIAIKSAFDPNSEEKRIYQKYK